MGARVQETNLGGDVDYTITGTEQEVDREVEKLFKRFDPAGYNTREVYRKETAGVVRVIVTRWNSCD